MAEKQRAPRNRTITLSESDRVALRHDVVSEDKFDPHLLDVTCVGDCLRIAPRLPAASVDLLVLDPPYNLNKEFGGSRFRKRAVDEYTDWLATILDAFIPCLRETASIYICGDWHTSISILAAASERFIVRNRITWEREKGRGAKTNWKNSSEDIWFCTKGKSYTFNVDSVKLRRKVIAPYRDAGGRPKDWNESADGKFRDTHPSNIWTDITIPFWSMPENTDHPTQKSEKLLAKLIMASSDIGDVVLDPFLGSGTTSVVAKKLGRRFIGIEAVEEYAMLAAWRLKQASVDSAIQGYSDSVFWERNTLNYMNGGGGCQKEVSSNSSTKKDQESLF